MTAAKPDITQPFIRLCTDIATLMVERIEEKKLLHMKSQLSKTMFICLIQLQM